MLGQLLLDISDHVVGGRVLFVRVPRFRRCVNDVLGALFSGAQHQPDDGGEEHVVVPLGIVVPEKVCLAESWTEDVDVVASLVQFDDDSVASCKARSSNKVAS